MINTPRKDDVALLSLIETENFSQVSKDPYWIKAMEEEMSQIEKNETWELVPRPKDKNIIGTKWVFKNKMKMENSSEIKPDLSAKDTCKLKELTSKKPLHQ